MRFQGQKLGYVAGSSTDGKSVIYRLPHGDLSKAPRLGDLLMVHDQTNSHRWLARVENEVHVSIELHEGEVRNAIARGQTNLGSELSDHEKEMYLGHDFTLKLLGELRGEKMEFKPVVRSLPPRGSHLTHLKKEEIQQLVTLDKDGTKIGFYAVGDEVNKESGNEIPVKFDVKRFVSRRTAIFGVAGFGKSNLMKNILAELTVEQPTIGKLIFDLDGEYAFGPQEKGQSERSKGLADIPSVRERLLVYTTAKLNKSEYQETIGGEPVLNLGELSPRKVVSTLLPESRRDRVYADLLRGLSKDKWIESLKLVSADRYDTDPQRLAEVLKINYEENLASINGLIRALVPMLFGHVAHSMMLRDTIENLRMGATVVVDLSRMGLDAAFHLTSFLIDEIFETNQQIFVDGGTVPEIVVFIEEAQNLLSDSQVREGNPIVRLAKEGRKYNLGMVYVTQQPGAIAKEILSQTNNFFVLHLLSKFDISALTQVNPHYDGVIADFISMESLQGHAYIYSTVPGMPTQSYVFATRATSFDETVTHLSNIPEKGSRAIRQKRKEVVEQLAKWTKELLASQQEVQLEDGRKKYRAPLITGELAKKLTLELDFVRATSNRNYVDNIWLERACEHLGFEAKVEWEDKKPHLYLKDKTQAHLSIPGSTSSNSVKRKQ